MTLIADVSVENFNIVCGDEEMDFFFGKRRR